MKVVGIITEYNPFHNGHKLHLKKSLNLSEADAVICIMSGNFMQRGIPSLVDKWTRTSMALSNGVDLVLELPSIFATSSAEFFAKGAVSILNSLGVVDSLCFGSELGDIKNLKLISNVLLEEPSFFKESLKNYCKEGLPFHKARSLALSDYFKEKNQLIEDIDIILNSSNNILGMEYIKNLLKLNSSIKPLTIKREGSDYNEKLLQSKTASATAIREACLKNNDISSIHDFIPYESYNILKNFLNEGNYFTDPNSMFPFIRYNLLVNSDALKFIPEVSEGLDNRILKSLWSSSSLDELILKIKSKRYTYTRINRILCSIFIGTYDFNILNLRDTSPSYGRVLGLNKKGSKILKAIKNKGNINLITKVPSKVEDSMLKLDIQSTNAYSLISSNINFNDDYFKSPIIFK
ncbi:nucleotidyltransferase [Clostridium fallax]|uniref:tRNA(Met) cytidine acetate ligase n=1 Tax=Clostridium fallax TaxID=1533 RepID=A0A1M4UVA3_9CLOT|nr:nucleotidyltransferase [Clostridium fallax]SHE60615.1 Predicted nucleotidyltransferase [Clostridium fallax]SQB06867.1 Protein of uncharacterised function (DUF795) [Clostridium fallax]